LSRDKNSILHHPQEPKPSGTVMGKDDSLDYAQSGVDIDLEGSAVNALVKSLKGSALRKSGEFGAPVEHAGGFSGLVEFGDSLLAMCTDGVGSKLMLASQLGEWETVGIDCMAMNVNDLICIGAEPLAFVDYIATPKPDPVTHAAVGLGLGNAAKLAKVTLAGGETASLPGIVNDLDLSGTALGWLPKGNQLTGEKITSNDVLIGLPSSGIHSNGYSLVREVIKRTGIELKDKCPFDAIHENRTIHRFSSSNSDLSFGEVILNPTRIYVDPLVDLFKLCWAKEGPCEWNDIHGIAHITGGGLSNLLRLHPSMGYHISNPLSVLPEFQWLAENGNIADREMHRTFNMGLGIVLVVSKESSEKICEWIKNKIHGTAIIGHVVDSTHKVTHINPDIIFEHY